MYALVKAIDLALIERCGTTYSAVCLEFMWQEDGMQLIASKLDQVRTFATNLFKVYVI